MPQALKDGLRSLIDEREEVYFLGLLSILIFMVVTDKATALEFIGGAVAAYTAMVAGKAVKK